MWSTTIVAFIATTTTLIANQVILLFFNKRSHIFQRFIANIEHNRDQRKSIIEGVPDLCGKRLYAMRRFHWALETDDKERIERNFIKYNEALEIWNENNIKFYVLTELYFNLHLREILVQEVSKRMIDASSYIIVRHKKGVPTKCQKTIALLDEAAARLEYLLKGLIREMEKDQEPLNKRSFF